MTEDAETDAHVRMLKPFGPVQDTVKGAMTNWRHTLLLDDIPIRPVVEPMPFINVERGGIRILDDVVQDPEVWVGWSANAH